MKKWNVYVRLDDGVSPRGFEKCVVVDAVVAKTKAEAMFLAGMRLDVKPDQVAAVTARPTDAPDKT